MDCFESSQFLNSEGLLGCWPPLHWDSVIVPSHIDNDALTTAPSFTSLASANETFEPSSAGPKCLASNAQFLKDSELCNQDTIIHSLPMWDNTLTSPKYQAPSTTLFWEEAPPRTVTATNNSPSEFSPNLLSPRVERKPKPRQSKVVGDVAAKFLHYCPAEAPEKPNEFLRLDNDNNCRGHPLYQNVVPKEDGLYHCPWEDQEECQHKPVKLKCEYDKWVDSHLKPYSCNVAVCEDSRFSSTACLLRHERESHGMHGHGDKPYLCTYQGCDRSVPGNGFPRHWNLQDHMKRIHNDLPPTENKAIGYTSLPDEPAKVKKRKAGSTDLDEAPKSSATPPAAIGQIHESRLLERYHQHEQRLLEIVKQLHDPRKASNMHLLWGATNCITVMAQMAERIKVASTSGNLRQTNRTE